MAKKRKKRKVKKSRKKSRRVKKSRKKSRRVKKSRKRKVSKKRQLFKAPNQSKDSEGNTIIKVSDSWAHHAYVNESKYKKKYKLSLKENEKFWAKEGKRISWIKKYTKVKDIKYSKEEVKVKWYYDGTLNASANCIDRHLKKNAKKTAIIWVGDDPTDSKKISYKELHQNVCKAANGLKSIGVQKGDRVTFRCGPSFSSRSFSSAGLPIRKVPPLMGTIVKSDNVFGTLSTNNSISLSAIGLCLAIILA